MAKENKPTQIGKQDKGYNAKSSAKGGKAKIKKTNNISSVNFANWVNAIGNIHITIPQSELNKEYNRIRNSIVRSMRRYEKMGADTSFFELPDVPKKITQASIDKIQMKAYEWAYITDRKVDLEKLPNGQIPDNWEKTSPGAVAMRAKINFYKQQKKLEKIQQKRIEDERERLRQENLDNIYWQMAEDEGMMWDDLPSSVENYALKIMSIAYDALSPEDSTAKRYHAMTKRKYNRRKAYSFSGSQLALFNVVKKKAEISIREFLDRGFTDPKKNVEYSKNLEKDFYNIAKAFEEWLWESDQYSNPKMTGLNMVINYATRDLPTSGRKKKEYAKMQEE